LIEDFYIKLLESEVHPKIPPGVLKNYEVALLYLQRFGTGNLSEKRLPELNPEAFEVWVQIEEDVDFPYFCVHLLPKKIQGNLNIINSPFFLKFLLVVTRRNNTIKKFAERSRSGKVICQIEEIKGTLSLYENLVYEFPKLKKAGSIYLSSCLDNCNFSNLIEIEKNLFLSNTHLINLPELVKIGGDLHLRGSKNQELPKLERVGGDLHLQYSKIQELPNLKEVGGGLDLRSSQVKELPNLVEIVWGLSLINSKIQELPSLIKVGGNIVITEMKKQYWENYFRNTGREHLSQKLITPT
jgi:hypothetical protein